MPEAQNTFLEFYKTTLDYRARVISIIFASGVAVAIPNIVTFFDNRSKALNEHERQVNELQIKQADQKLKQLEMDIAKSAKYQDYVARFIEQAMNQDIEVRIRFAEYLAAVSDEAEHWEAFRKTLVGKRDELDEKKRLLAAEQDKKAPDGTELATLSQQIIRLEQQTKSVSAFVSGPSGIRSITAARLFEFFGSPAANFEDPGCQKVDNEALATQLATETVGKMKVTMLRPAIESLKTIIASVARGEPALADSIGSMGALCIRKERGTQSLSKHAFGTALDISLDGKFLPLGMSVSGDLSQRMARVADYFEKAGWVWGGRFAVSDPMHFEVGADLFEYWVREGIVKPASSANTGRKP